MAAAEELELRLDLCLFVPCSPVLFDLLILLGQQGLITLLLKSGPNLEFRTAESDSVFTN